VERVVLLGVLLVVVELVVHGQTHQVETGQRIPVGVVVEVLTIMQLIKVVTEVQVL
jgi:hypothetical protein